jgi:glycosyltransferase involved in cell wall biosynthesis
MRIVMACMDEFWIDRRILHQAKTLREAGHEVILYAMPAPECPPQEIVAGVPVYRHWFPQGILEKTARFISRKIRGATWLPGNMAIFRFLKGTRNQLRKVLGGFEQKESVPVDVEALATFEPALVREILGWQPDCVVAHDLPVLRAVVVAGQRANAKIIYDSHECYPEIKFFSPPLQEYYRRLEARWIREAHVATTVNPLLADYMAKRYQRPLEWITNAIDPPEDFLPGKPYDHFRKTLGLSSATRILLYQGGFAPNRGLENLIEAMAHVQPGVHLVMLGYNDFKDTLIRLARKGGVHERVHVVPPRTQADLLEWTASADAGIIPYHAVDANAWYVSPNKLFEYIAAELPFLSNELPFVKTVVEDTKGGLIADLTTPQRCGKAINDLFADVSRLRQLRDNLHRCRADYLWKKQGEKLLQLYEAIGVGPVGNLAAA